MKHVLTKLGAVLSCGITTMALAAGASFEIVPIDDEGVGFNDPTPVTPVPGNPGTTLGEQRMNVFNAAIATWTANLNSDQKTYIAAFWEPLPCDSTGVVLAATRPVNHIYNFDSTWIGMPIKRDTIYPIALANKLAGVRYLDDQADILIRFNLNYGSANCGAGRKFNLALDGVHNGSIDLFDVAVHEIAHGLGFASTASLTDGSWKFGMPDIFSTFLHDETLGKNFAQMSNPERLFSSRNYSRVGWNSENTNAYSKRVLTKGVPQVQFWLPGEGSSAIDVALANFGPALTKTGVSGVVFTAGTACAPFTYSGFQPGKFIAVIDRGGCSFATKAYYAQLAGAKGAVIVNSIANQEFGEGATIGLGEQGITIPTVLVSKYDGDRIKTTPNRQIRTLAIKIEENRYLGHTGMGRAMMYTPRIPEPGSSLGHFDIRATKNLLMEPNQTTTTTGNVVEPDDITAYALRDLGW
jgi:PA domain